MYIHAYTYIYIYTYTYTYIYVYTYIYIWIICDMCNLCVCIHKGYLYICVYQIIYAHNTYISTWFIYIYLADDLTKKPTPGQYTIVNGDRVSRQSLRRRMCTSIFTKTILTAPSTYNPAPSKESYCIQ